LFRFGPEPGSPEPTSAPSTVSSKALSDGSVLVENARGTARLSRLGPGVLSYACTGVLDAAFHPPMIAFAQREMDRAERMTMLVDGWDLRSVDTAFREAWTEWFKRHRQHFQMRLLVRSKLMDMAASLANLFTGVNVIKTYSSVDAWERDCRQHVPNFQRAPTRADVQRA
jgi:hypothetical protein